MENSILFSSEAADELNNRVTSDIAPHLFLFLDYCPNYLIPPNDDGKYHLAIANLYSIFKDTAWIILDFNYIYTGEKHFNSGFEKSVSTQKLRNIFENVSALRTLQGHTSSAGDPLAQGRCEHWFDSVLEKSKPKTTNDYYLLLQELEKYARIIIEECDKFIDCVKTASNQEAMIRRWEDSIIKKYIVKRDMFYNSASKYFYSNPKTESVTNIPTTGQFYNKIKNLIISYYYYDYEKIKSFTTIGLPAEISNYLNKVANDLSLERVNNLNRKIRGLNLHSLENLYPCNREKEVAEKLVDFFLSSEFEMLIRNTLNRSIDKSLVIEDIVVRLFDETATYLYLPNGEKIGTFYRFNTGLENL